MKIRLSGDHYFSVEVDGVPLDPAPSLAVWNHSPTGFAWGYGGSGPSQLALALLLHAGLPTDRAVELHQRFKWEHVANWPQEGGEVEVDVAEWALFAEAS